MKPTHHQRIKEMLKSGDWVCSSAFLYMKDHRKRISELRAGGLEIDSEPCDGRCNTKHQSNIHMYRLAHPPKKQVVEQLPNGHVRVSYV